MKPNGKCIAKKCEDCNFYYDWDMTDKTGLRQNMKKCLGLVVKEEIHLTRGSIDGLQEAVNESRNRSMETREAVDSFAKSCLKVFKLISVRVPKLLGKQ